MKRLVVAAAVILVFAGVASAGPVAPEKIAADAKWFGHADLQAIRGLKIVQAWKAKMWADPRHQAKMKEVADKLGMNPSEDLLGVTLYGTQYGDKGLVALVHVQKVDREKMLAFFKHKHPDHKTSEYAGRTVYSWSMHHHDKKVDVAGTFANDKLIVLGCGIDQVKAALDVLDGKKPGLAKDAALIKGLGKNTLCAARALDVPEAYRKTTKCPVLRICKAVSVHWTETGGRLHGHYELTADSAETAKTLQTAVEGLKAIVTLRLGNLPEVKKVLDGVTYKASGDRFTLDVKTTEGDVQAAIKAAKPLLPKHHFHHGMPAPGAKDHCPAPGKDVCPVPEKKAPEKKAPDKKLREKIREKAREKTEKKGTGI